MFASRRFTVVSTLGSLLAAAAVVTLPASVGAAAQLAAPAFGYDAEPDQDATPAPGDAIAEIDAAAIECMAKVVLHEAANQPYDGKVAVAQTLMNRLSTGRMGGSICEVVNQPGQFFRTAAYHPDQDGAGWQTAVQVARAVLGGGTGTVVPGAMFFRSAAAPASSFFRTRQRLGTIGAQVFYR